MSVEAGICAFCHEQNRAPDSIWCADCRDLIESIPEGYYYRETLDGGELVRKQEKP